jgi:hypothetical protein
MMFGLSHKIKFLIDAFKTRVLGDSGVFEGEDCTHRQLTSIDNKGLLDSASLVITPNGYKTGKLYSVVPSDGSGDMDVTRATTATRVNEQGLIERVPYNLFNRSEEFNDAYWIIFNSTLTPNAAIAPNGTTTADLLTKTSAINTVASVVKTTSVFTSVGVHTLSYYVKQNVGNIVLCRLDSSGNSCNSIFNFTTKTFTNSGANFISSSYQELSNGWFRIILTGNVINANWTCDIANLFSNPTNDSVYIWGAQVVEGTEPKDYYPTTTGLNIPRIDYSNGSCPNILVEPQRANLLTYSEEIENASWTKQRGDIVIEDIGIPFYAKTRKMVTTSATPRFYRSYSQALNQTMTYSFFVKRGDYDEFELQFGDNTGREVRGRFNLSTFTSSITVDGFSGSLARLETNYPNGWVRASITFTTIVTATSTVYFQGVTPTIGSYIYIWGAQLEAGANATSYIPTVASAVTRNADVISKTGVSSLIGQTEGTILVKGYQLDRGMILTINEISSNNGILFFCVDTNGRVEYVVKKNNVSVSSSADVLPNRQTNKNIIIKYSQTSIKIFINGVLFSTYTYPSSTDFTSTLDRVNFGSLTERGYAKFELISIWKTQLSDTQCIQLTTL